MLSLRPFFSIKQDILPLLPEAERSRYHKHLAHSDDSDSAANIERVSMSSGSNSRTASFVSLFTGSSAFVDDHEDEDHSRVTISTSTSEHSSVTSSPAILSTPGPEGLSVVVEQPRTPSSVLSFEDSLSSGPTSPEGKREPETPRFLVSKSFATNSMSNLSHISNSDSAPSHDDLVHLSGHDEKHDDLFYRISIVCKEADGTVIVARDSKDANGRPTTVISYFDLETRAHVDLCIQESHIFIVSVSINRKKSLLALTTISRTPVDDHFEDQYESKFLRIGHQGESLMKTKKSPELQRFQFLSDDHILVIYDKESISIYSTPSIIREDDPKVRKSTRQQAPVVLVKKHVWFEWKAHHNKLYFLTPQSDRVSKIHAESEHILTCYDLSNPKEPKIVYRHSLMFLPPKINRHPVVFLQSSHSPLLWMNGRASPEPMMTLVEMPNNALCLCRQEHLDATPVRPNMFKIAIYLLHKRSTIGMTIPAFRCESSTFKKTFVLFTTLHDLLVLYIPKQHIQFIDCGNEHMCEGPFHFNGATLSSSDWYADDMEAFMLVPCSPPDSRSYITASEEHDLSSDYLLSVFGSCIYTASIDKSVFLKTMCEEGIHHDAEAMHFAIAHLQDDILVDQIIMEICRCCPHRLTFELLREYLIGKPYQSLKSSGIPSHLLRLIPISSCPPFGNPETRDLRKLNGLRYECMSNAANSFFTPTYGRSPESMRLTFDQMNEMRQSPSPDQIPQNKNVTVRGLIRKMSEIFKPEDVFRFQDNAFTESGPGLYSRLQLAELLTEHFTDHYPREIKCSFWSREYIVAQSLATSRLYRCIQPQHESGEPSVSATMNMLNVYENLYAAIEELSCPAPKDFLPEMSRLAAISMPKAMILQYMRRGVVDYSPRKWDEYHIQDPAFQVKMDDPESFKRYLLHRSTNLTEMVECTQHQDQDCIELLGLCYANVPVDVFHAEAEMMNDPDDQNGVQDKEFQPLSAVLCQSNLGSSLMTDIVVSKYIHVFTKNQHKELDLTDEERIPKFLPA